MDLPKLGTFTADWVNKKGNSIHRFDLGQMIMFHLLVQSHKNSLVDRTQTHIIQHYPVKVDTTEVRK